MTQRLSTKEEYLKRINIMVEYINNHMDENIELSKLAGIANFSPYHFHRIVKAFLGEPIGAFIVRMRLETAARLLRYTDLPIQEIAFRVGYDMPSSLSKGFKSFYAISPNEYRNNKNYTIMKPSEVNPDLKLKSRVVELEKKQVIYVRLTGDYKKNDYCSAWETLWGYVKEAKLFSAGIEHICIYHDDPVVTEADKLRTDVCLVLPKAAMPKGEIGVKEVAGGKYVVFHYQGPYENLGMVYDTIYGKCLPEGAYQFRTLPSFEKYLNHPDRTEPEKLKTEIYIPIE